MIGRKMSNTKHAVRYRVKDARGELDYDHRPPQPLSYTYIMPDGSPATDEARAEADKCDICFPPPLTKLIDRGPAAALAAKK